jgi:hypothetical protein
MVAGHTAPEPNNKIVANPKIYKEIHDHWLASKIELPVSEGSRKELESSAQKISFKRYKNDPEKYFYDLLKTTGIDISELAGRIRIEGIKTKYLCEGCSGDDNGDPCAERCGKIEKQITLLPEKEEGQDTTRLDVIDFINEWTSNKGYTNIPRSRFDDFIKDFIKQFTIIKNK